MASPLTFQTSIFVSLEDLEGDEGSGVRSKETRDLCAKIQRKALLCSVKLTQGEVDLVTNDFDAAIADDGCQVFIYIVNAIYQNGFRPNIEAKFKTSLLKRLTQKNTNLLDRILLASSPKR
ncbi:MAG: hypothetical protein EOR16_33590 [Mesorhizobium sp.]|uniref:hypothetical protein n=1 Tax=Mesorhizobium sp. TaxID=1871066 RepID=UPI000FE54132|nr:hypothetical protein [Mesorhizobium sp.]RWI48081.1 MAG: hypothetical protein EOR16_33590 [Mesorhizobium sp.]